MNLLENGARDAKAEPRPTVLLGNEDGQEAGGGERTDELRGIRASCIKRPPIRSGEVGTQRAYGVADLEMIGNIHVAWHGHAQRIENGSGADSPRFVQTVFVSRNSSTARNPFSRPYPLALRPPNGAMKLTAL
jgi:hypothetical protein